MYKVVFTLKSGAQFGMQGKEFDYKAVTDEIASAKDKGTVAEFKSKEENIVIRINPNEIAVLVIQNVTEPLVKPAKPQLVVPS